MSKRKRIAALDAEVDDLRGRLSRMKERADQFEDLVRRAEPIIAGRIQIRSWEADDWLTEKRKTRIFATTDTVLSFTSYDMTNDPQAKLAASIHAAQDEFLATIRPSDVPMAPPVDAVDDPCPYSGGWCADHDTTLPHGRHYIGDPRPAPGSNAAALERLARLPR